MLKAISKRVNIETVVSTRILCRGPALQTVFDNIDTIIRSVEEYSDNSSGEAASKAQ